ncbi:group II intron reverse transcriptase/maturase [Heliorestis acidaminivorans]|nr:group II intron reverse transcriptase/maturase [Heliorestis acidaminivorans]
MQKAEVILSILGERSINDRNYKFERIYRNFFNEDFYLLAYKKLLTTNIAYKYEKKPLDKEVIKDLITNMKNEKYKFLFTSKQEDFGLNHKVSLLMEITKEILKKIYSPIFIESPSAYEVKKSPFEALAEIKKNGLNKNWAIEGNLQDIRSKLDVNILATFLKDKINDGRMIELIKTIFTSPYKMPMLEEIYFSYFDSFLANMTNEKLYYSRYEDQFLFLIEGTKEIAQRLENTIKAYFSAIYLQDLPGRLINLNDQKIFFLDYEIFISSKNTNVQGSCNLIVPTSVINEKIKAFTAHGKAIHCHNRMNLPIAEIVKIYDQEIKAFYQYYALADDVKRKIKKFKYYHYQSLLKTIARKEKGTISKVKKKYLLSYKDNGYYFVCK